MATRRKLLVLSVSCLGCGRNIRTAKGNRSDAKGRNHPIQDAGCHCPPRCMVRLTLRDGSDISQFAAIAWRVAGSMIVMPGGGLVARARLDHSDARHDGC